MHYDRNYSGNRVIIYNENNDYAAEWLENLSEANAIAPGYVDRRSIEDLKASDVSEATQVHFFAGIGVWSYALRCAGWPDDRHIWTGSCPCQPFSGAGTRRGFDDPRHLWPAWFRLIRACRPVTIIGEQVSGPGGRKWIDLVFNDLENEGYATGALITTAAGVGAPHKRERIYWMADANSGDTQQHSRQRAASGHQEGWRPRDRIERCGYFDRLANAGGEGRGQGRGALADGADGGNAGRAVDTDRGARGMADSHGRNAGPERQQRSREHGQQSPDGRADESANASPFNDYWRNADWLACTDGKWRPVESFFQSLANGITCGMGYVRTEALETEIISYAKANQRNPYKDLRDLWHALPTAISSEWSFGGYHGIYEAEILFAFLCQLAGQGWTFTKSLPLSRSKEPLKELRVLWDRQKTSGSPCQRRLDKQQSGKSANSLYILSSILARHAYSSWGKSLQKNAQTRHPLAHGVANRVGQLRAYGNALNAKQAQAFIETVMEII